MIFGNVCSLRNKLDELQANVNRNTSLLVFTKTWLDDAVSNNELATDSFNTPFRVDRDKLITGKEHGGGMCTCVNESWCNTVIIRDLELLTLSLCPFHLPREFPQLFYIVVYVHPRANVDKATELLVNTLHNHLT